jgi:hypothetical protein
VIVVAVCHDQNPGNVGARVFVNALCAVLHGLAFYKLPDTDVQNRLGSLYYGWVQGGGGGVMGKRGMRREEEAWRPLKVLMLTSDADA